MRSAAAGISLLGLMLLGSVGAEAARAAPVTVDAPAVIDCGVTNTVVSYTCTEPAISAGVYWNGTNEDRGLVRFNLGEVPPGSVIVSAHLSTTPPNTDTWQDHPLSAHQILQSWTSDVDWLRRDGVQHWMTAGGDIGPILDSSLPCCGQSYWDVTALVQDWVSATAPNYGIMLVGTAPETQTGVGGFNSIEWGVGEPRLTITYEPDVVAPDVYLDGGLYEDRATELVPDLYDLAIDARDNARVTEVRVLVDGAVAHVAGPDQPCGEIACGVDTDFDLDANNFTGTHSFEVRARDAAGNVRSIAWTASFNGTPFPIDDLLDEGLDGRSEALPTASGDGAGCGFVTQPDARLLTHDRPTAIVNGRWKGDRGAGPETTEYYGDRRYRVTRCRADGTLLISQLVGPVRVPGGIALLELGRTVPEGDDFGTSILEYASPRDPVFAKAWARGRARALANTIPPTKP